ncbi:hypothetical protein QWJ07_31270 [Frankia sp. RB7]|nr:hypothetical protein [Frankia sp. RB7]
MNEALKDKHRRRAIGALADHLCATDMTTGFCSPIYITGMMSGEVRCARNSGRNCVARAEGLVQAIENRGCSIVWDHDPALKGKT